MGHSQGLFCEGVTGIRTRQVFRFFFVNAETLVAVSRRVPGTRGWKVNNHLWDDWRFVERGSVG